MAIGVLLLPVLAASPPQRKKHLPAVHNEQFLKQLRLVCESKLRRQHMQQRIAAFEPKLPSKPAPPLKPLPPFDVFEIPFLAGFGEKPIYNFIKRSWSMPDGRLWDLFRLFTVLAETGRVRENVYRLTQRRSKYAGMLMYEHATLRVWRGHVFVAEFLSTATQFRGKQLEHYLVYIFEDSCGRALRPPVFYDKLNKCCTRCPDFVYGKKPVEKLVPIFFSNSSSDAVITFEGPKYQECGRAASKLHAVFRKEVSTDAGKERLTLTSDDDDTLADVTFNDGSLTQVDVQQPNTVEFKAIGYKSARAADGVTVVVKLGFDDSCTLTKSVGSKGKCRADRAKVLALGRVVTTVSSTVLDLDAETKAFSCYSDAFMYELGKDVCVPDFDDNPAHECSAGIHFFFTMEEALAYYGKSCQPPIANKEHMLMAGLQRAVSSTSSRSTDDLLPPVATNSNKPLDYQVKLPASNVSLDDGGAPALRPLTQCHPVIVKNRRWKNASRYMRALDLEVDPKLKHIPYKLGAVNLKTLEWPSFE